MNRGAFAVVAKDDKILLVRALTSLKFMNHWSLPGGVVEDGETLRSGAEREVAEETGIICQAGTLLAETDNIESNIHISIFNASYISGKIVLEDGEIAEARWVTIQDALDLPLAYNLEAILKDLAFKI